MTILDAILAANKDYKDNYLIFALMLKKQSSIVMMFIAMALLLGHNLIPHSHHHDFEHSNTGHHHSAGHHHGDDADDHNKNEQSDTGHLFFHFQHGEKGVVFIINDHVRNIVKNQLSILASTLPETFIFQPNTGLVRQHSPPYKTVFRNIHYLIPTGLRAPPAVIV